MTGTSTHKGMNPSEENSWIPDDPTAVVAWDLATYHAEEAIFLYEKAEDCYQLNTEGYDRAAQLLLKAMAGHQVLAAAYLAIGGFGNDRFTHLLMSVPFTSKEPTDGWDV